MSQYRGQELVGAVRYVILWRGQITLREDVHIATSDAFNTTCLSKFSSPLSIPASLVQGWRGKAGPGLMASSNAEDPEYDDDTSELESSHQGVKRRRLNNPIHGDGNGAESDGSNSSATFQKGKSKYKVFKEHTQLTKGTEQDY